MCRLFFTACGTGGFWWYIGTRVPMLQYRKRIIDLFYNFAQEPRSIISEYATNSELTHILRKNDNNGYLSRGIKFIDNIPENTFNYHIGIDNGYSIYWDYLERFFDLCAKYRRHVIIYSFPWPKEANDAKDFNDVYSYYDHKTKQLAINNSFIHFIDYNHYWEKKYFVDPLHLNQQGAEILTKKAYNWASSYL